MSIALSLKDDGPAIIAVNPRSMLGSKMVKEAYGVGGGDLRIGAEILCRAALSDEFAAASGRYFDNDSGQFTSPHPDALNRQKCSKISLYSGLNDLKRKSIEELTELRQAGLTMAYTGLESGDRVTLERINKGLTPEQAEEGMAKAKAAGIEILVSIIFGIGGKERSREHIVETTRLLNLMEPEQIAPTALTVQPGTELEKKVETGEFIQATPLQILEEEKYLLDNLADFDTMYWGDHGNNIVSSRGMLPASRELFLKKIEHAIATHPVTKQDVLLTSPW